MKASRLLCALLLTLGGLLPLVSCESQASKQQRAIRLHQAAALAQARADSALAAGHVDSATTYHRQQHALRPTAADTTTLRSFFATYFGW